MVSDISVSSVKRAGKGTEIGEGAWDICHEKGLTDCGERCLGEVISTHRLATWSDDPVEEIRNVLALPVSTTNTPPRVVDKSSEVSSTVGWVWVT